MTATAHFADPRNEQIRLMQPLVRRVARHLRAQLPPSVDVDDLIQAGLIGLNEAIGRCDMIGEEIDRERWMSIASTNHPPYGMIAPSSRSGFMRQAS